MSISSRLRSTPDNSACDFVLRSEGEKALPLFIEQWLGDKDFSKVPNLTFKKDGKIIHNKKIDLITEMDSIPYPDFNLIKNGIKQTYGYKIVPVQTSRGCPFDCEFCDITALFGRTPRVKTAQQFVSELQAIYDIGWRDRIFIVDDNFIGNKLKIKEILKCQIEWMNKHDRPFTFLTEASINLADDDKLIELMVEAGFDTVFIGLETPNYDSLRECEKRQNCRTDMLQSIEKLQKSGLQVLGGYIIGFDNDDESIFSRQIKFIQESGVVTAMVGLLNAPRGTRLYQRLVKENRLLRDVTGDNTDFSINFIPKMNYDSLINGYKNVINTIYSPNHYYNRVITFLKEFNPVKTKLQNRTFIFHFNYLKAFFKSMLFLGIKGKERFHYWKLFFWTLFNRPRAFPLALTFAIYGFHFRKIFENFSSLHEQKNTSN